MTAPITLSQTGVGATRVHIPDYLMNPFNIGLGVVVSGTVTYNVEHTFDDAESSTPTNWFVNTGFSAQTTNQDGNYAVPVRGIRLNVTAGTGTATLTICQAGTR